MMRLQRLSFTLPLLLEEMKKQGINPPDKGNLSRTNYHIMLVNVLRASVGQQPYDESTAHAAATILQNTVKYLLLNGRLPSDYVLGKRRVWLSSDKPKPVPVKTVRQHAITKTPKEDSFVASTDFLETDEWKRLRYDALKRYGRRCVCCGATPEDGIKLNVDHIKPRKTHPELALDIKNLQILCADCNCGKGNRDSTDWRHLEQQTVEQKLDKKALEELAETGRVSYLKLISGES